MPNPITDVTAVVCPTCDAGASVPCAKIGPLVTYEGDFSQPVIAVKGNGFHQERWRAAMSWVDHGGK